MTLPTAPFPTTGDGLVDDCDAIRPGDLYGIADMVAAGATAKQVDHWTRAGLLRPAARDNATNGVPRRWPEPERDVCARMALLVDVGLSLRLAHDVARHLGPGPYRARGVRISVTPEHPEQIATDDERRILRHPGRALVAAALHTLHDTAAAASDLLGLDTLGLDDRPLSDRYTLDGLIQMADLITKPDLTHSDTTPDQGEDATD